MRQGACGERFAARPSSRSRQGQGVAAGGVAGERGHRIGSAERLRAGRWSGARRSSTCFAALGPGRGAPAARARQPARPAGDREDAALPRACPARRRQGGRVVRGGRCPMGRAAGYGGFARMIRSLAGILRDGLPRPGPRQAPAPDRGDGRRAAPETCWRTSRFSPASPEEAVGKRSSSSFRRANSSKRWPGSSPRCSSSRTSTGPTPACST